MKDEIFRIKNQDYSKLDDRLFNSLSRTNQLDNTITQLMELQNYLKTQIGKIQNQQQKQAAMKASKIVLEIGSNGFQTKCQCHHKFTNILNQITTANKSYKKFKQYLNKQCSTYYSDTQQMIQQSFQYILTKYNRKNTENNKLQAKVNNLQADITQLKTDNKRLIQQLHGQKQSIRELSTHISKSKGIRQITPLQESQQNLNKPLSKLNSHMRSNSEITDMTDKDYPFNQLKNSSDRDRLSITPKLPMPLRKQSQGVINRMIKTQFEEKKGDYNIIQENYQIRRSSSVGYKSLQIDKKEQKFNRNEPMFYGRKTDGCTNNMNKFIEKQNKDHSKNKVNFKTHGINSAQQFMLKTKGADTKEHSKRKIKIFSHF